MYFESGLMVYHTTVYHRTTSGLIQNSVCPDAKHLLYKSIYHSEISRLSRHTNFTHKPKFFASPNAKTVRQNLRPPVKRTCAQTTHYVRYCIHYTHEEGVELDSVNKHIWKVRKSLGKEQGSKQVSLTPSSPPPPISVSTRTIRALGNRTPHLPELDLVTSRKRPDRSASLILLNT